MANEESPAKNSKRAKNSKNGAPRKPRASKGNGKQVAPEPSGEAVETKPAGVLRRGGRDRADGI